MSRYPLYRRQFLTLPLKLFLPPLLVNTAPWRAHAGPETRRTAYDVDVGVLWDAMTFHLPGALEEAVDRAAGRYEIKAVGQGSKIQNRVESRHSGRDAFEQRPAEFVSRHVLQHPAAAAI